MNRTEKPVSDDFNEKRMTFTEHLGELRTRLIRSGIALIVMVVLCYIFSDHIFQALKRPLSALSGTSVVIQQEQPPGDENSGEGEGENTPPPASEQGQVPGQRVRGADWQVLSPLEPIIVKLKIAGYGGLLLALPFIVWQLCAFVFPGLRPVEKKAVQIIIFGCGVLAIAGVCVAYFGVFPLVVPYLIGQFVPEDVEVVFRMNETLSFVIKGLAAFAIAFQFPMVVLALVYVGLLEPATLKQYRRIAIVSMAVVAAMLTPPDPFTMSVMLIPLVLLYEVSIWLSYLVVRRKKKNADAAS